MTDKQLKFIKQYRRRVNSTQFFEKHIDKFTEFAKNQIAEDIAWLERNAKEYFFLERFIGVSERYDLLPSYFTYKELSNEEKFTNLRNNLN
jgi:hypothetical protein